MYKIIITIFLCLSTLLASIKDVSIEKTLNDSISTQIETLYSNNIERRGGSAVISKIASFLPNLKEVGFFTNMLNLYFQISQFVRSTNKVISTMSMVKSDIRNAGNSIKKVYNTIQDLKEISLYDMATWQTTCQRLNFIATESTVGLVRIYGDMFEHSIGAAHEYVGEIENLEEHAEKRWYVLGLTSEYYIDSSYSRSMSLITGVVGQKFQEQINSLEDKYANELAKEDPSWYKLNRLAWEIARYEQMMENVDEYIPKGKIDTIIATSHELIATNIMEINEMELQLQKIEDNAAELVDVYNKMKEGNLATQPKDPKELSEDLKDINDLYSEHANDVKAPEKPEGGENPTTVKKEVSAQDILQLENGILFLLYKQDIMKRDISAMKLNTMTFVTVLEAFEQEQQEMNVTEVSAKNYMMALRIKDYLDD